MSSENAAPVAGVAAAQPDEIKTAGVVDVAESARRSKWYRWRRDGKALIAYLLDSEVHTFAFSVAANAILSFIPFVVLLYTLALSVFHSQAMVNVVNDMVNYFLPSATKEPNWIIHYILKDAVMPMVHHKGAQLFSLVMILVSCTGIFLPLEVALNQAWGVTKSRNYLFNQLVAFGLAILMVTLGMGSVALNAAADQVLTVVFFHHTDNFVFNGISSIILAITTGVAVVVFLFAIYWLLPNRRVSPRPIVRTALITGIVWLAARYIFVTVLPHLDLESLYGPFFVSVGLIFWAYVSGLILFAGAQFSVARMGDRKK
ncbi:MAG TPA: YihY/virulence factor BrkB family protein [Terracidiphilus sp.]|nr:YihY/virulence factor BrkB family protein [Terracidiphilus sp.]